MWVRFPPGPPAGGAWLAPALLFVALAGYLLFAERVVLFGPALLPTGDNAADDLLVQDALRLHLLHGNYSRFQFYHPGPWFFYVAAAGELVFMRWTALFRSAFAAQLFAVSLTHAVALAVSCRLWVLVSGRVTRGLLATGVIAAGIAAPLAPVNPFVQLWIPYAIIAAALLMATGLAGCVLRGASWLPVLALGAAQMMHGHAGLLVLVPATWVLALALWMTLSGTAVTWASLAAYLRCNPFDIGSSLTIGGLYAAPILLHTVRHWPGEFGGYLAMAGAFRPQPLGAAMGVTLRFMPLSGAWLVLLLLPGGDRRSRAACLVVLLPAFAAGFWYAWRGIDSLANLYLLVWLAPFGGTACVAALLGALSNARLRRSGHIGLSLVAVLLCAWTLRSTRRDSVFDTRANLSLRQAVARLQALPLPAAGRRTELVLDPTPLGWAASWPETVTVLAALARGGRTDFCVSPMSWNLLFGAALRCDATSDRIAGRWLVTAAPAAMPGLLVRLDRGAIIAPPGLRPGIQMTVRGAIQRGLVLEPGWSVVQAGGVWTEGKQAGLRFPATGLPARFTLTLRGMLLAPQGAAQRVTILDAGAARFAAVEAISGPTTLTLHGLSTPPGQSTVSLTLRVAMPTMPAGHGRHRDRRLLGFLLTGLRIDP